MAKTGKKPLIRAALEQRSGNEPVYMAIGILLGLVIFPLVGLITTDFQSFLYDLAPEAVGIIFTVLVLNRLDQIREDRQTRDRLIREAHSRYNQFALQAIEELRVLGWLEDGRLRGKELRGSNWKDANLYQADLQGCDLKRAIFDDADLYGANLKDANVTDDQLRKAKTLRFATMPNGKRYDGRFNLKHDLELMRDPRPDFYADPNNPEEVARFYGVPVEEYLQGQQEEAARRSA